jgi:hypothetical protein
MSTAVALADSTGTSARARPVVVPSSTASPTPEVTPSAVPIAPQPSVPAVVAETVPAPEPEDVAAPPAADLHAGEPSAATEDELARQVEASGSWDAVYAWAQKRGWSQDRVDAWIARLDAKIAEKHAKDDSLNRSYLQGAASRDQIDPQLPAQAGNASERDLSGLSFGSKREQSRVPPD